MRRVSFALAFIAACGFSSMVRGQGGIASAPAKFLVPATQTIAVRAGRLFDSRNGTILNNQIVLVRGDRIVDVGPSVAIPSDARVIDLSGATVLPGMIDGHVHNAGRGDSVEMKTIVMVQSAARDLDAGFTTSALVSCSVRVAVRH